MVVPRVLLVSFALLAGVVGYKERDCSARSTWPDGTEIERDCIVEGESGKRGAASSGAGRKDSISSEFGWMKDTRWNWNDWRDVVFLKDGSFLAPAEGCEREGSPKCRWSSDEDRIFVLFGGAGRHTLEATPDRDQLFGSRDADGDSVTAKRVQ